VRFSQTVYLHNKGDVSMVFHFAKLNSRIKTTWPGRTNNSEATSDTIIIDARQDCLVVIQDEDGFERIRLQNVDPGGVSIIRAYKQLQIWNINAGRHLLLAIIEDPDNDGITTIDEIIINKNTGFVAKNIDMGNPLAFKSGSAYDPCANMEESGLALLAGNSTVSDTMKDLITVH